jgi:hypothetical protein
VRGDTPVMSRLRMFWGRSLLEEEVSSSHFSSRSLPMQLYPVSSPAASTIAEGAGGATIVAGGLVSPTGPPLGLHEVSALAVGGTAKIRTGDTVLMLKVVGVVKASVRRDGRIQAQGSPADYARLGVVEERLDRAAAAGQLYRGDDRAGRGPGTRAVGAGLAGAVAAGAVGLAHVDGSGAAGVTAGQGADRGADRARRA